MLIPLSSPLNSSARNRHWRSGPRNSFLFNKKMVTRVESKWNDLISDFHRIKGIIAVLYPVNHAPGVSRTIGF